MRSTADALGEATQLRSLSFISTSLSLGISHAVSAANHESLAMAGRFCLHRRVFETIHMGLWRPKSWPSQTCAGQVVGGVLRVAMVGFAKGACNWQMQLERQFLESIWSSAILMSHRALDQRASSMMMALNHVTLRFSDPEMESQYVVEQLSAQVRGLCGSCEPRCIFDADS